MYMEIISSFISEIEVPMFNLKFLVCAFLALGHVTLSRAEKKTDVCSTFETPVDVSPTHKLNDDDLKISTKEISMTLQGVCNFVEDGKNGVQIQVLSLPIYDLSEESPGDLNSDSYDNVQLYFANADPCYIASGSENPKPCYRILEVRFNRFEKYQLRLLSKPYNVLKDTGLPPAELNVTTDEVQGIWSATLTFSPELLPKDFDRVGVFVVDSTQPDRYTRYTSTYRIYNHALTIIDLQVPSNYQMLEEDLANIVLPEENSEYSDYWSGL